jgi:hypothetical protein
LSRGGEASFGAQRDFDVGVADTFAEPHALMVDGHAADHDKVNWPHLAESHQGRDTCGGLLGRSLPGRDEEISGSSRLKGFSEAGIGTAM